MEGIEEEIPEVVRGVPSCTRWKTSRSSISFMPSYSARRPLQTMGLGNCDQNAPIRTLILRNSSLRFWGTSKPFFVFGCLNQNVFLFTRSMSNNRTNVNLLDTPAGPQEDWSTYTGSVNSGLVCGLSQAVEPKYTPGQRQTPRWPSGVVFRPHIDGSWHGRHHPTAPRIRPEGCRILGT